MKSKGGRDDPKGAGPFHNPFTQLKKLEAAVPAAPATPQVTTSPKPEKKGPPKAVVRREKKGRGGKEVTLVEQLELPPAELEKWLKSLKSELGCGGALEDGALVLQGDQRERLKVLLEKRGVRRVILG